MHSIASRRYSSAVMDAWRIKVAASGFIAGSFRLEMGAKFYYLHLSWEFVNKLDRSVIGSLRESQDEHRYEYGLFWCLFGPKRECFQKHTA
jgi:hypothetical protein